jgi:tetratricopeptide (TPR) repeat protein
LGNLGRAYAALGKMDKATQYFEQRLTIVREIGDKRGEAIAGWNLGLVYEEVGDLKRAVDQMQISVGFERQMGHKDAEKYADYLKNVRARLEKK